MIKLQKSCPQNLKPRLMAFSLIKASLCDQKTFDEAIADSKLNALKSDLDKRYIRNLYTSFFRHLGQSSQILDLFFKLQNNKFADDLEILLNLGITELFFLRTETHAVLHSWVELSKSILPQQFSKVINGVLRNVDRKRGEKNITSILENPIFNIPDWMQEKL